MKFHLENDSFSSTWTSNASSPWHYYTMHEKNARAIDWRIVLINSAFILFQLLVQRTAAYQGSDSSGALLFFLNSCFVGFSFGMILYARFPLWLGGRLGEIAGTLSLSLLGSLFLIQHPTDSDYLFRLMLFCAVFLPSGLFGILLSPYASRNSLPFLLAMTFGTVIGMVAYYFCLAYWPFFVSFWLVSIVPLWIEFRRRSLSADHFILAVIGMGVLSGLFLPLPADPSVLQRYYTPMGMTEISKAQMLRLPPSADQPDPSLTVFRMVTDRQSPTHIARKGDLASVEPQARIPYLVHRPKEVLVIGTGGGQDLVAALYYGARRVTGIEINKKRIQLMRQQFAAVSNGLYLDPRIQILEDDARHAMRYLSDPYDLIVLQRPWTKYFYDRFLIDATAPLMTEEAIAEYWRLLKRDGLLFIALPRYGGRSKEILISLKARFSLSFLKAHLAVLILKQPNGGRMLILLLSKVGFPREKREALRKSGLDLVYFPGDAAPTIDTDMYGLLFSTPPPGVAFKDGLRPPSWPGPPMWLLIGGTALILLTSVRMRPPSLGSSPAIYIVLGILYFWLEALLLLHSSLLLGNVMIVYYLAIPTFILSGGLGYLHASYLPTPRSVQVSCLALMIVLLVVWGFNLLGSWTPGPWIEKLLVASLFGVLGYLSAYPFGYLIAREKKKLYAFAWDSFGMALGYPTLLIVLGHGSLDQLLIQLAVFYGMLALWIPRLSRNMRALA